MKRLFAILVITCGFIAPSLAAPPVLIPGPFPFEVVRVYDGDTFTVQVYLWPGMTFQTSIRVTGLDTPELKNSGCDRAAQIAKAAREFTVQALAKAKSRTIVNIQEDKYGGRVDATVLLDGRSLTDLLIAQGLAKPYNGGTKTPWCP